MTLTMNMDKKTAEAFDRAQTRERIEKLRQEIDHHRYLYHIFDRQEISDADPHQQSFIPNTKF